MRDYMQMREFRHELQKFLVAEGVAGMLVDSNKEHGLVNMTGATSNFTQAELPEAFLTTESYGLIWRLLKRGPVEIEIDLKNTFSDGEVEVYNTVAEIPGSEKPDEVVIIGGHIDSWDLGTGATDNGTGIMAVLEAARALKAVGVKPKRTIRFVLFSGEEAGPARLARLRQGAREGDVQDLRRLDPRHGDRPGQEHRAAGPLRPARGHGQGRRAVQGGRQPGGAEHAQA